jgi:hypothetical protein
MKSEECFDKLRSCQVLKEHPSPLSYLVGVLKILKLYCYCSPQTLFIKARHSVMDVPYFSKEAKGLKDVLYIS